MIYKQIVVNKKAQVNISYRKRIRQEIYFIKKYGLNSHLEIIKHYSDKTTYLNNLYGRILFVLQVNKADNEFLEYKKYINYLKTQ